MRSVTEAALTAAEPTGRFGGGTKAAPCVGGQRAVCEATSWPSGGARVSLTHLAWGPRPIGSSSASSKAHGQAKAKQGWGCPPAKTRRQEPSFRHRDVSEHLSEHAAPGTASVTAQGVLLPPRGPGSPGGTRTQHNYPDGSPGTFHPCPTGKKDITQPGTGKDRGDTARAQVYTRLAVSALVTCHSQGAERGC